MHPDLIEHHVTASAALIGLDIPADCRAGVLRYFGIAAEMASLVMAHPLGRDDESGAVFVPVSPTPSTGLASSAAPARP
jgi:hypothetical protein